MKRGVYDLFVNQGKKKKEISCCRRAAAMKRPLQNRGLLKCDVQDETGRKPVASGALQVGYLPPR